MQIPPGNWIAPPGSNRGSRGGNKSAGALGVEGCIGNLAIMQAVMEVNAEQAPKSEMQEPTSRLIEGRPTLMGEYERISHISPAGVVATACMKTWTRRNTGSPSGDPQYGINWQLARARPGRLGWRGGS